MALVHTTYIFFNFSWYIGETPLLNENISISEVENEDATVTYTSTLDYAGKSDEFGEMLKCKITHSGKDLSRYGRNCFTQSHFMKLQLRRGLRGYPRTPLWVDFWDHDLL